MHTVNKKLDRIDKELAKTYFGTSAKKKAKWPRIALLTMTIVAASLLVTISAIYLLRHKHTASVPSSPGKGKIFYNFEKDSEGWGIPAWELEKLDHVAKTLKNSKRIASSGAGSLELYAEFPGTSWSAALIEVQQYINLEKYDGISADVFLPSGGPQGLKAKFIFTVGENWNFVEMSRLVPLQAGSWTTISADLSQKSTDWRKTKVDNAFKIDVRKIAIRIESNKARYSGPIYIDNIRLES